MSHCPCPFFPSHNVSPDPSGKIGTIGTCNRCHLHYRIKKANPYVLERDSLASAAVIKALALVRKLPTGEYAKLLEAKDVAQALEKIGLHRSGKGGGGASSRSLK